MSVVQGILDVTEIPVFFAERSGRIVLANQRATGCMEQLGFGLGSNLFTDILHLEPHAVFGQLEGGEHEVLLPVECPDGAARARVRWLPEPDWVVVSVQHDLASAVPGDPQVRQTLQELLQEREITYRNLLAAYLRLQEVNRQKTLFLASAAHELKTPLAVMKGYYDLLLSGSLGKMNEKQRDILLESKESCERLVRLVSMFLNYSALESGKLVMHPRENDLRDCITELVARWHDAFRRKNVRLDTRVDSRLEPFTFDYQKVLQTIANLLDNALKHTPSAGSVALTAEPHFWERRISVAAATEERRTNAHRKPNSVLVSVSDTGPGIAAEYHQEIFEDFVRVDRSSSGMGLGLAIAKRLVQAHRGKIWVDSEPGRGCTFTFLLPTENA
jgi:signal transduction histidine kinase